MTTQPTFPDPLPVFSRSWSWQRLLQLVADRNPFYLLSAACMLWGCLSMTNSSSWSSVPLTRLLLLIGTINVYEAALSGLALLLIGRGLLRDGKILLIVQAFFLVDVTFLSAEVATASLRAGIAVNVVLFALALLKLRLVAPALGLAITPARFAHLAVQIATLLAIPCVLRHLDHGSVTPRQFYAVWWWVGLMPVVGEAIHRVVDAHAGYPAVRRVPSGPALAFVTLPWASLLLHMGILHYVYDVPFYGAMAAPVLLGLAWLVNQVAPGSIPLAAYRTVRTPTSIVALKVLLPAAAVLVSMNDPHVLAFDLRPLSSTSLNTGALASTAAYLTAVYTLMPEQAFALIGAAVFTAIAVLFGPTLQQIAQFWEDAWSCATKLVWAVVPTTVAAWGVISVLASFVFLFVGAAVSFGGSRLSLPEAPGERRV